MAIRDEAQVGKEYLRYDELRGSRSRKRQECADYIAALNAVSKKLNSVLEKPEGRADVSLPRFPDKAKIIESFNNMLNDENELRVLASRLNLPLDTSARST